MDGRDEIMFGNMVIDDNGRGLVTTGLGHGDAQHCGDLDPYRWGLEQFECNETNPGCTYWNATTGQLYYRKTAGGDDGRAVAGNFQRLSRSEGRTVSSGLSPVERSGFPDDAGRRWHGQPEPCASIGTAICTRKYFDTRCGSCRSITKWVNGRIFTSIGHSATHQEQPRALGDNIGECARSYYP
jgi:hypothetical protein